uniref:Uncharacterized protein n=1 Tax=Hyaloperonospora arabidopsidis (strain Emoy2) TaxID=559515 RepID=M4BLM5_HYAAE
MQTAIEMKLTWILDSVNKLGVIGNVQVINTDSDQALKIAENIFMKLVKDLIYLSSECPPIFGDLVKKISIVALRVSNKEYKLATVCLDKDGQDPNHRHEQCDKILC